MKQLFLKSPFNLIIWKLSQAFFQPKSNIQSFSVEEEDVEGGEQQQEQHHNSLNIGSLYFNKTMKCCLIYIGFFLLQFNIYLVFP